MKMIKSTLLALFAVIGVAGAEPKVVSSIYPLQQIANAVVGKTTGLVAKTHLSPHHYTVKPNDARAVLDADLFVWLGESMMPQLRAHVARRLERRQPTIRAAGVEGIKLITLGKAHQHEDDDHNHGKIDYDPHLWLSTDNAGAIASEIARQLAIIDADNQAVYAANLERFKQGLTQTKAQIRRDFADNPPKPYFIFHDAYRYFEKEFGIEHIDVIRGHAGQAPLTKHLVALKGKMQEDTSACLFREPQFHSPLVNQLVTGTEIVVSELDPLGYQQQQSDIDNGYFAIVKAIARQLQQCGK